MWTAIASRVRAILDNQKNSRNKETAQLETPQTEKIGGEKNNKNTNPTPTNVDTNDNVDISTSDKNTTMEENSTPKKEKGSVKDKLGKFGDKMEKVGAVMSAISDVTNNQGQAVPFQNITPTVVSDERLKDIFGEETPIDCFAKIHSYEFKYTPEAQEMMQGKNHVDDKEHLGVMAQELLMNPATSACVIKDTDGFLKVDTAQLTMANTATIAELSRKVQKLEEMLGER